MREFHQQPSNWRPPDGLLASTLLERLKSEQLPVILPGVARVVELPVAKQHGRGPRVLRQWAYEGKTDAHGHIEIPLWAAISVVQTPAVYTGSGTSASKAFGSNIAAGSAIIVTCAMFNGSGAAANPSSITDTLTNTYTRDVTVLSATNTSRGDFIASAPNSGAGANTVSIAWSSGSYTVRGIITEISGLAASSILDGSHSVSASTASPSDSVSFTAANVIVIGHMGSEATNTRTVTLTTTGGTEFGQVNTGASAPIFSSAYKLATSANSPFTHSWTISSTAANTKVLMAAYKASAAGGSGVGASAGVASASSVGSSLVAAIAAAAGGAASVIVGSATAVAVGAAAGAAVAGAAAALDLLGVGVAAAISTVLGVSTFDLVGIGVATGSAVGLAVSAFSGWGKAARRTSSFSKQSVKASTWSKDSSIDKEWTE